jgi:hypothetical protein
MNIPKESGLVAAGIEFGSSSCDGEERKVEEKTLTHGARLPVR